MPPRRGWILFWLARLQICRAYGAAPPRRHQHEWKLFRYRRFLGSHFTVFFIMAGDDDFLALGNPFKELTKAGLGFQCSDTFHYLSFS
jgi:hypothetical protein